MPGIEGRLATSRYSGICGILMIWLGLPSMLPSSMSGTVNSQSQTRKQLLLQQLLSALTAYNNGILFVLILVVLSIASTAVRHSYYYSSILLLPSLFSLRLWLPPMDQDVNTVCPYEMSPPKPTPSQSPAFQPQLITLYMRIGPKSISR